MSLLRCFDGVIVIYNVLVICQSNAPYKKISKEQALSDVLKNITLANKILENLLKNYERLDKIYNSEEFLKSDTSLSKGDQSFKHFTPSKQSYEQRERSYKKYTNNPNIGTAIIYDSESIEQASQDTKETKKVFTNVKPGEIHYVKDKNNRFQTKKNVIDKSMGKNKSKFKKSSEAIESDEVEQLVIEIPSVESDVGLKTMTESFVQSYSNKSIKNILGDKIRFSIKHTFPNKIRNNGRRIKKNVYSKLFTPNKIIPVKLRNDGNLGYKKRRSKIQKNEKITVLILTTNQEKNDNLKEGLRVHELKANTKEYLQKIDSVNKSLRSEYGDACLLMPIKKCKKALQIVNKNICKRRFKCKPDFKSDFLNYSAVSCNKEFTYRENDENTFKENTTNNEKFSPPDFNKLKRKCIKNRGDQRSNKVCLDKFLDHSIALRNETPKDAFLRARDKYEKKCQAESTKKCNNACNFALNETCSVHTCEKRKKKAIKGECKSQCKKAYKKSKEKIKSSSSSDSDSDSDSDSGSD